MAGFTQGGYPDGTTQAMHDRYFGAETREECQRCEGTGKIACGCDDGYTTDTNPWGIGGEIVVICSHCEGQSEITCPDCRGSGYETPADTREDDAYEQAREDGDIEF